MFHAFRPITHVPLLGINYMGQNCQLWPPLPAAEFRTGLTLPATLSLANTCSCAMEILPPPRKAVTDDLLPAIVDNRHDNIV